MSNDHDTVVVEAPRHGAAKLSQAALILLGQAAERRDGMLLPPPAALRARGGALGKVLQALLKAALVSEVPVGEAAQGWRTEEDGRQIGLAITPEGFRAIGLPVPEPVRAAVPATPEELAADQAGLVAGQAAAPAGPKRDTKQARLVSLLSVEDGTSVAALAAALAWQNHTVRAALTGLRQKGHDLVKLRDAGGTTVYRIVAVTHTAPGTIGQGA